MGPGDPPRRPANRMPGQLADAGAWLDRRAGQPLYFQTALPSADLTSPQAARISLVTASGSGT